MGCASSNIEVNQSGASTNRFTPQQLKQIKAIDVEKYSRTLFDSFNLIRGNLKKYSQLLIDVSDASLNKSSSLPEPEAKLFEHLQSYLQTHEEDKNLIKELSKHLDVTSSNPVPWNDNVYKVLAKKPCDDTANDCITEINKAVNHNLCSIDFTLEHFHEAEYAIWHLLLENKERFTQLLQENYLYGTAVTYKKSGFKVVLVLLNENTREVLIDGNNPVTGAKEPLSLNDEVFKNVDFKTQIIEGHYIYSGDTLNVTFKLFTGEIKEMNIEI